MKKALVLGGGGFIGSHIAKRLKSVGFWVRVVDIKEKPSFFEVGEICDEYLSLDLRSSAATSKAFYHPDQITIDDSENAFDEVYNLAADMGGAGYIFSGENDFDVMSNSARINLNVSTLACTHGVKRLFFSSSACVYPEHNQTNPNDPITEESTAYPADPDSEYGWEKLFSERLYFAANRNKGLEVRVARYHNVYGPHGTWNDGKEKAPAALCRKIAMADDEIEMWGDGLQTRSFLYIDDAVDATIDFMRQDKHPGPVNIGSEEMVTIKGLAEVIMRVAGKDVSFRHKLSAPTGVRGRSSHNDLLRELIDFEPKYRLADGIVPTYNWIKKQIG